MEGKNYTINLDKTRVITAVFVLLFHAVGLYGFLNAEWHEKFTTLVPFHLLLMFVLMLISHRNFERDFLIFLTIVYVAGFGIEFLGVHTGLIFGNYKYGETLGLKLADIPLLIGLNWVILVYSVGVSMHQFGVKNDTLRAGIGALILVILDLLIEPVAIQFDYWSWANGSIPTQNYIAWFVFSFACLLLFNRLKFAKVNPVAVVLVLAQFVFFIALNITA